jgi:TolB-like protein/class 3 adenylate cyclase/Tfp pilus assembly protein PilF
MAEKGFKRKLTAILSADVEGYSRLMGQDEEATVRTLTSYREVLSNLIQQHNGKVLDSTGDNLLAEFVSVVDAVQCAVAVQKEISARNTEFPENRKMQFRIGINLGDVIQEENRIYGDGVNIAARLEALADPGGICVSKTAFDHIEAKLPLGYEFLGEQEVKNIAKPVGAYRVLMEPRVTVAKEKETPEAIPFWRRKAVIAGTIAAVVVIISVSVWSVYLRPPSIEPASVEKMAYPLPEKPSIAVLPFDNMSDDPKQAYISDGITENIIMAISKTPKLFVIARNSTFAYKDKPINIKQAAEELGVRYILEGSVQKTENRVRITAQLIDATTGRHQWAERYDRELKDIFALQDEITLEIITALQVELTEGEQSRIHRGSTTNLEAFLKILKGREHHFRYTTEDIEIAKRMYREAIALDPKYATAYFWLAYAIDAELNEGWSKSREKDIEQLFELSDKILALDNSSAQAHIILSRFYIFTGQPDRAITEAEKAVDLDPNDADGYAFGGLALNQTKRYKEAIPWFRKAIRRNPSPPIWYLTSLCGACIASDQHHEASATAKRLVNNYPDRHTGYFFMGVSNLAMDNYDEAIAAFKKAINIAPTNPINFHLCAVTLSLAGQHEEALGMIKKAINFGRQESQDNQNMRLSHLAEYNRRIGRYEEAIDAGRKLLDNNPNNKHALRAYITLTCAYSALGKAVDAGEAAAKILQIIPDFSMEAITIKDSWFGLSFYDWFLKHEPDNNLLVTALRKAGLQE